MATVRGRYGAVPVAAALLALGAATPGGSPARASSVRVEAEDGSVDNPLCGDSGQQMQSYEAPGTSGGKHVFFPATGCSETFSAAEPVTTITSIRFYMSGAGDDVVHCGHFEASGGIIGTTPVVCAMTKKVVTAEFQATYRAGPYTITWVVDETQSSSWIDAWVDYLTGT